MAPSDVDRALMAVAQSGIGMEGWLPPGARGLRTLAIGRFGERLHTIVVEGFNACDKWAPHFGNTLAHITVTRLGWSEDDLLKGTVTLDGLCSLLSGPDPVGQALGALVVMEHTFTHNDEPEPSVIAVGDLVPPLLLSPHHFVQFAASWALVWLGPYGWEPTRKPEVLMMLVKLWSGTTNRQVRRQASWATCTLPIVPRNSLSLPVPDKQTISDIVGALSEPEISEWPGQVSEAALTVAYYFGALLSDAELAERVVSIIQKQKEHLVSRKRRWATSILRNLGQPGEAKLHELGWDKEEKEPN